MNVYLKSPEEWVVESGLVKNPAIAKMFVKCGWVRINGRVAVSGVSYSRPMTIFLDEEADESRYTENREIGFSHG